MNKDKIIQGMKREQSLKLTIFQQMKNKGRIGESSLNKTLEQISNENGDPEQYEYIPEDEFDLPRKS